MVFNDTSTKLGIIQRCEQWTGLGDTGISGDATLLKQFTGIVNDGFDEIMPLLLSYTDKGRWDDLNNTDYPIATFNLVSGQNDYSVKVDGSSLDILRIFDVQILDSPTSTDYVTITKIGLDDPKAIPAMAPASTDTGTPEWWLERDNVIFLNPNPNYSATNGVKIFFERIESYFASTDTTKAPGIPRIFHPLLVFIASRDWLVMNKPSNTVNIATLNQKITLLKQGITDLSSARNPTHSRIRTNYEPETGQMAPRDSNK